MGYIWPYSSFTYLLTYLLTTSVSGPVTGYPIALPDGYPHYPGNKLPGYGGSVPIRRNPNPNPESGFGESGRHR